jgi:hypothetical protein
MKQVALVRLLELVHLVSFDQPNEPNNRQRCWGVSS